MEALRTGTDRIPAGAERHQSDRAGQHRLLFWQSHHPDHPHHRHGRTGADGGRPGQSGRGRLTGYRRQRFGAAGPCPRAPDGNGIPGRRHAGRQRPDQWAADQSGGQSSDAAAGLELTELATGLTLRDFAGSIGITREQITISGLNAAISAGGRVSANGTVGLGEGLPAELAIQAVNARYSDGRVVTADLNADLRLSGPLAGTGTGGRLSGTVNISTANINIPQSLPGALSPLAVKHLNAPKPVRAQIAELQAEGGSSGGQQSSASAPIGLDITLSAPSRVFVRGRGVDAELGGTLRLAGTTANPQALGGFTLRRGLLDILTRRLTFSRGSIGFTGSLTPNLDFLAATSAGSTSINLMVTGSAADPVIDLTSSPALPQDEILAQLLFDRSVTNLSPTQIAQLAAAVTSLTGGSDTGPLSQLRKSLGLDAVDVNLGGADGPSLSAGRYINENIYLGWNRELPPIPAG
ncbi:translocation/assembly module TamB domain-containing protein [Pannonibacter sp. Pt2-lr]